MPLNNQDITWLARLARIEISAEENASAQQQINDFFTLVEQIQAVDTNGVEPLSHPLAIRQVLTQRLRPDAVNETITSEQRTAYQACAPAVADGFYLVPRVVE